MRYAGIEHYEVVNGHKNGMSLYVQGCPFHCKGCHNPETWDFSGGYLWTEEIKQNFLLSAERPYIKRISMLGGEPLAKQNLLGIWNLTIALKDKFPNKKIWLYSGFTIEAIFAPIYIKPLSEEAQIRINIVKNCDVIVDGLYEESKRDITLPFRGSTNQRLIDIQKTLSTKEIVLWQEE